jgi:hypothetical protein
VKTSRRTAHNYFLASENCLLTAMIDTNIDTSIKRTATNRFCARIELDPPTQRILRRKTGTSTTIIMRMPTTSSLVLRERARAASAIAAANNDAGGSRFEDCWTPSSELLVEPHASSSSSPHDVASKTRRHNRVNLFILVRILLQYLEKVDPATSTFAREVSFSHNAVSSECKTVPSPRAAAPSPCVAHTPRTSHNIISHTLNNRSSRIADASTTFRSPSSLHSPTPYTNVCEKPSARRTGRSLGVYRGDWRSTNAGREWRM